MKTLYYFTEFDKEYGVMKCMTNRLITVSVNIRFANMNLSNMSRFIIPNMSYCKIALLFFSFYLRRKLLQVKFSLRLDC